MRSCIKARFDEYGDVGGSWDSSGSRRVFMIEASVDGRDGPRGTALWSTGPIVGGGGW